MESPSDFLGPSRRLSLAWHVCSDAKSGQMNAALVVNDDIRRLYVFMDEALGVDLTQGAAEADSDREELAEIHRRANKTI